MDEQKYIKGFNAGYHLKQNMPELYELFTKNQSLNGDYMQGFQEGGAQLDKEREKPKENMYVDIDMDSLDPIPDIEPNTAPDKDKDFEK